MSVLKKAEMLKEAEETKRPIARFANLTVDEAYQIQLDQIQAKVKNGATIVGKKIGLTSKAMQEMFQVNEPDYGHLLDCMMYPDGASISLSSFIQPKVEFEMAFVLKKDLSGPGVTLLDVIDATEYIVPAIEIIDSRIKDWDITFENTVADNGSSAGAVIGINPIPIDKVDVTKTGMVVYRNGAYLDAASSGAVMGNPARAVQWLANALSRYDISLYKGEVILSGALTKAVQVEKGDRFTVIFDHLGTVSCSFE
ncbi:MAG TPA: 2-keto-4-pentenoate hydratase [Massilibacterium sp.]|nr:2-keto-4-pentenoate hydratase [Massilibacterium sp.]